jgi:hypothetical protein
MRKRKECRHKHRKGYEVKSGKGLDLGSREQESISRGIEGNQNRQGLLTLGV